SRASSAAPRSSGAPRTRRRSGRTARRLHPSRATSAGSTRRTSSSTTGSPARSRICACSRRRRSTGSTRTRACRGTARSSAGTGRIVHAVRRGEMAVRKEVPFGLYYGTVDATPLFVMLAARYFEQPRDLEHLRRLWPHIERALTWIDQYGDQDGDGFVEYSR